MIKVKDGYAKLINTTYTGSADRVLLSNGGDKAISDFAAASSLNNYVTLNTNQTITGVKTFSNALILNKGTSINDNLGNGILGVNCTNWTGIPSDGSSVSLGTLYNSLYFRSSKDNMYHYRFDTNTAYKILDESNYLGIVRPSGYISSGTANLSSYWCKMWDITHTSLYNDLDLTLYVHSTCNDVRGIIHIRIRPNPTYDDEGKTVSGVFTLQISIVQITGNLNLDRFRLYHNSSGHCELWGDIGGLWGVYNYCLLSCTNRVDKEIKNYGKFYNTSFSTELTLPTDKYYNLTNVLYKQTYVQQHTTNNVEYPLVWSNLGNANNVYSELLYKSYAHLLYNPALKRITTGQYVANNGDGPHFTARSASGRWAYIRLHNSSNYYDIATNNTTDGLWLARPNGVNKGIFVSSAGKVAISSDLNNITNDVPNELTVSGVSSFTSPNIPVHIKRSTTFPAIGYFGGDDANTIYGYIGFKDANKPAWCKTDGRTVYNFLHTGNSEISEYAVKINDTTANFVRDWGDAQGTLGSVAKGGRSSMGMVCLPESDDNPNKATGWHHFINISYRDGGGGTNSWITQIANKGGTTDLWVRSRRGGTVDDAVEWSAPWTPILTGTNYHNYATPSLTWSVITKVNEWNRILTIDNYCNVLLSLRFSQNSLASEHLYLISGGFNCANISLIGYNNFQGNSDILIRIVIESNTKYHIEIYNKYGYNGSTDLWVGCKATNIGFSGTLTKVEKPTEVVGGTVYQTITSSYNKAANFNVENAENLNGYPSSSYWRNSAEKNWTPNTNIRMTPLASNQDWSFDFRDKGSYTGSYWQVWDETKYALLRVNADDGKVMAPYGFVGDLTATTLDVNGESKFNRVMHVYSNTSNYTEGIRLYGTAKNDTWSCIMFGCDPAATSGTHPNQWLIGRDNLNRLTFRNSSSDRLLLSPTELFLHLADPTLTIYSGRITDVKSDGNVCLQTCIDGTNGRTHDYATLFQYRNNLVLLPRGGLVYIGYNPDPGNATYKLWINGNVYSNGYVEPNTGSSLKGIKFGDNSYLNSLNGLLIWQSSEAIRFGSSSWNWNDWAGLKYNHSLKTIYLGIADGVIFNSNNNTLSGGNIKFPGILYITLDTASIIITTLTSSNYRTLSEFYKGSSENSTYTWDAQIGWHNTGDTDGALVLLPYATDSDPWNASVGLYISKTRLLYNSNTVLTSNNYPSILDQRYYTETESDARYYTKTLSDAKYLSLTSPVFYQHLQGYWTKILTFTIQKDSLKPSISFSWHPTECARDVWGDFNINIREESIIFMANWKGNNVRTLKCVGDGLTYDVWVYGNKEAWDPYGVLQVTAKYNIITYQAGALAYQDTDPTGTYSADATKYGWVKNAETATDAKHLIINGITNDIKYGTYGGIIQDASNGPESGTWHNSIKILHHNSAGYYTQLAHNFTGTNGLWHRRCVNGTVSAWSRLIDDQGGTIYGNLTLHQTSNIDSFKIIFQRGTANNNSYIDWEQYVSSGNMRFTCNNTTDGSFATMVQFSESGLVTSSGFVKSGSSDSYILLGGGGHKAISDFTLKTEADNKYAKLASPNNLLHNSNEFTFASPAFSGEIHFNWRTSSGEKDGDITAYYFDDGKGSTLAKISKNFFDGSAASLRDYNNAKVITASYASGGFSTNPTWLCAWNSYHITYVSPSVLEVKSANYLNSVGLANPQTGRTLNYGNVYSYNTNASAHEGAPTTYTSVIGFGRGVAGTVEICGDWTIGRGLWVRALRDYQDNWYEWDRILTESTYTLVLDSKYLAKDAYTFKTLSGVNHSGWVNNATDDKIIPTMSFIAYWNGAYSGTVSNLTYCKKGAFGDAAVKSVTTSVTSNSTALVTSGGVYTALSGYLSLAGGTMTGSIITPADDSKGIIPAANNYGQIGSSDKKFYRMYAATFYGDLSGNATSATSTTQLSGSGVTSDPTPNSNGTLSVCYGGGSGYTGTTSMAFAAILNFGSYSRGFLLWAARTNAGTNNSLKFRIGNNAATAWDTEKTILDDTNYSTYITSVNYANSAGKLGTSTLGSSSQPIYLNGGTPTVCSFKIWKGTLSQYNAISSKDSNTLYFITD